MTQAWHQLTWDSEFFGIPIGRIELDRTEAGRIVAAESEARDAGIACLYGELDPGNVAGIDLVQRLGYRLMEVALDLDHRTSVLVDPPPTTSTVRLGTIDDLPYLTEQIEAVAPWSRYAVDPRFGTGAATAMHRAWVARAAAGERGRILLVAEDATGITGLSTVYTTDRATTAGKRIDLIASTKSRSGAAQALVAYAFAGFGPGPSSGGPIAARNLASLRFSEQMGYRVARTRYLFHRWLDESNFERSAPRPAKVTVP